MQGFQHFLNKPYEQLGYHSAVLRGSTEDFVGDNTTGCLSLMVCKYMLVNCIRVQSLVN